MRKRHIKVNGRLYEAIPGRLGCHRNPRSLRESSERDLERSVREYLDSLSDRDLVLLWREYCSEDGAGSEILPMSELDEYLDTLSPYEAFMKGYFSHDDFNLNDDCFELDGYENLVSYPDYEEAVKDDMDVDSMVEYIVQGEEDLGDSGLEDILNEYRYGDGEDE